MIKRIIALAAALLVAISFVACGNSNDGTSTGTSEGGTSNSGFVIGYACKDVNDTFQTYLIDAAQEYADANGIKLNIGDAQNDVVKQQDQINDFITQGVDAIIVPIIDSSSAGPMTEAAQKAGIPLIYVNTLPYADGIFPEGTYYVGSVEREAGELQAEYIGELLGGKGNAVILQGTLVHEGAVQRSEGVADKLAEKYPDIKLLASEPADWQKDMAMSVTENLLTAHNNDIQAVFANNDEMALGAVNALQASGVTDAYVIGIDGTASALEAIKAGTLSGSIYQDAAGQSGRAMEMAHQLAQGETLEEQVEWVPFVLITPENVDEFMS